MSAPPPPGPGTPAYHGGTGTRQAPPLSPAAVAGLFASAGGTRRRDRRGTGKPYSRQGDPRGLFLTDREWSDYDEWTALHDRMERKYGHFRAMAMANRSIW